MEGLDRIRSNVYTTKVGAQTSYSLWGGTERMEALLEAWKDKWEREPKEDNIHYIELDMAELSECGIQPDSKEAVDLLNWKLWYALIGKLEEAVSIEEIGEEIGYDKVELEERKLYFKETKPEEICKLGNQSFPKVNREELLEYYSNCGIQLILVLKHFECCRTLFPREIETTFFSTLSALSAKMNLGKYSITMLLCSTEDISTLHHHQDKGLSPFMSCFPYGPESEGKLDGYSEEAIEEHLKQVRA